MLVLYFNNTNYEKNITLPQHLFGLPVVCIFTSRPVDMDERSECDRKAGDIRDSGHSGARQPRFASWQELLNLTRCVIRTVNTLHRARRF